VLSPKTTSTYHSEIPKSVFFEALFRKSNCRILFRTTKLVFLLNFKIFHRLDFEIFAINVSVFKKQHFFFPAIITLGGHILKISQILIFSLLTTCNIEYIRSLDVYKHFIWKIIKRGVLVQNNIFLWGWKDNMTNYKGEMLHYKKRFYFGIPLAPKKRQQP
jgi:hypothetical protein